jgi:dynamin 1-like protein
MMSQGWHLLQLLGKYVELYSSAILGTGAVLSEQATTQSLNGGARIRFIFNDVFSRNLASISPTTGLTTRDIRTAIKNAAVRFVLIIILWPSSPFSSLLTPL